MTAAQGHGPDCASLDRMHDPGPEGEGTFDERGRYRPVCDCESPTTADKLEVMAHRMTDAELRSCIESICGTPKHAGSQARRLNMGESLALAALMAEEARRVKA